jgi:hypothetical protein
VSPWVLIGMLVVASVTMWLRKRSWATVLHGPPLFAALGVAAGVVGLLVAIAAGTPLVESATSQAVQWSRYPIVRGSPQMFAMVALLVGVSALVVELAIRGCVVDWLLERKVPPFGAVLAGAMLDMVLITEPDGGFTARIGSGVFGIAMGWMFVAAGRSALPGICARIAFSVGALALEAFQIVG